MQLNNQLVYLCSDAHRRIARRIEEVGTRPVTLSASDLTDADMLSRGNLLILDFRPGQDGWLAELPSLDRPEFVIRDVQMRTPHLPIVVVTDGSRLTQDYVQMKELNVLDVVMEDMLTPRAVTSLLTGNEVTFTDEHYLSIKMDETACEWRAELQDTRRRLLSTHGERSSEETVPTVPMDRNVLEEFLQKVDKDRESLYQNRDAEHAINVRNIGVELFNLIFGDNRSTQLSSLYRFCHRKALPDQFTLEFCVDLKNRFPFELLCDPSIPEGFLSKRYKLYRVPRDITRFGESFASPEDMQVLLVGAITGWTATGPDGKHFNLGLTTHHVVDEIASIAQIMHQARVQITVLAKNEQCEIRQKMAQMGVNLENITFRFATITDVLDCLESENWDIVHFAGHSHWHTVPLDLCRHAQNGRCHFHQDDRVAGLMVFEEPGDIYPNNPYHGDASCLYHILKREPSVKFIYFSSCRSGRDVILTEAMQYSSAIFSLGFLWSMKGADASEFAIYFYKQLFRCLSNNTNNPVAEAVWQTQRHFSVPDGELGTLAPVLISQHF